jgi:UDP-GlcNAc:undecaprenyl-phosphate GlcNAc-1-phosphate transferase
VDLPWLAACTALFGATLLTAMLTRSHLVAARHLGILDHPDGRRKRHQHPVAQAGGLAMAIGCQWAVGLALFALPGGSTDFPALHTLIIGGALATALGALDDIVDLKPVAKLLGQLGVGLFFWYQGVRIERVTGFEGVPMEVPTVIGASMTALWFALLMNGLNMIDGLDGLAAGVGGISALTLAALAASLGQPTAALASLAVAGACGGFLVYNHPPARVFMGDAGSHFLGCQLAAISLLSSTKTPAVLTLALPLLAVALPLFETVFAFCRRVASGHHPFRGDRQHLHHRMIDLGFSDRRTLATFCYLTAACGIVALVSVDLPPHKALLLSLGVLGGLGVLTWNVRALEQSRRYSLENSPDRLRNKD